MPRTGNADDDPRDYGPVQPDEAVDWIAASEPDDEVTRAITEMVRGGYSAPFRTRDGGIAFRHLKNPPASWGDGKPLPPAGLIPQQAAEEPVTLVRAFVNKGTTGSWTYAAICTAETADMTEMMSEFGKPEILPWDMLPGAEPLARAHVARMGAQPKKVCTLGTTCFGEWATWYLPGEPPPVPDEGKRGAEGLAAVWKAVPRMTAGNVLDLLADLQRELHGSQRRDAMRGYAVRQYQGDRMDYHPGSSRDLDPWLDSLGTDLFGATAYQITSEMITLTENLRDHGERAPFSPEDLPAPWGFMWLDRPVGKPNTAGVQLPVHAFSWAQVPALRTADGTRARPGVRLRCWAYCGSRDPFRLELFGQVTFQLGPGTVQDDPVLRLVHRLWLLMGMEITAISRELPDRHARKRAANLRHQHVNVVTLRRPKHAQAAAGPHRHVDWSCTWIVRGHTRHYDHPLRTGPNAGLTDVWIKPYLKGPDGAPLRAGDILYRLSR